MGQPGEEKNVRAMNWIAEPHFQGWTCSRCERNYPLSTLLVDPEAKTAYDRLALGQVSSNTLARTILPALHPKQAETSPRT